MVAVQQLVTKELFGLGCSELAVQIRTEMGVPIAEFPGPGSDLADEFELADSTVEVLEFLDYLDWQGWSWSWLVLAWWW